MLFSPQKKPTIQNDEKCHVEPNVRRLFFFPRAFIDSFLAASLPFFLQPWKRSLLAFASPELRADPDLVLVAVRNHGRALEHASTTIQATTAVVLEAVKQNGLALMSASDTLKADEAVVAVAVSSSGWAYNYAAPALQANRAIAIAAVTSHAHVVEHVPLVSLAVCGLCLHFFGRTHTHTHTHKTKPSFSHG